MEFSKEWCVRMAQLEGNAEIGAGRLAIDPVFDGESASVVVTDEEGPNIVFGRFVRLMRRQRGIVSRSSPRTRMLTWSIWSRARVIRITNRSCARPISSPTTSMCPGPASCKWQG